jgi:hypothetical protein
MSVGVAIKKLSGRLAPNSKLATVDNTEMQIALIFAAMLIGILVFLVVRLW